MLLSEDRSAEVRPAVCRVRHTGRLGSVGQPGICPYCVPLFTPPKRLHTCSTYSCAQTRAGVLRPAMPSARPISRQEHSRYRWPRPAACSHMTACDLQHCVLPARLPAPVRVHITPQKSDLLDSSTARQLDTRAGQSLVNFLFRRLPSLVGVMAAAALARVGGGATGRHVSASAMVVVSTIAIAACTDIRCAAQ